MSVTGVRARTWASSLALGCLVAFGPGMQAAEAAINTHLHYLDQKSVSFTWDKASGGAIEPLGEDLLVVTPWGRIALVRANGAVAFLEGRVPMGLDGLLSYNKQSGEEPRSDRFRVADILLKPSSDGNYELFVTHHHFTGDCIRFRLSSTMVFLQGPAVQVSPSWRTIFDAEPCLSMFYQNGHEAGGRLLPDGRDHLLAVIGHHGVKEFAQDPGAHLGKLVRIEVESGEAKVLASGLRNPQGFARDADGTLWETEHGPQGGDELNVLEPGINYGWPLVSFGVRYGGWALRQGELNEAGTHPGSSRSAFSLFSWLRSIIPGTAEIGRPVFAWVPSIGISAMVVNDERQFPLWKDDWIIGSLRARTLYRVRRDGTDILYVEPIFVDLRIRDLARMPDGRIALLTHGDKGMVHFLSLSSTFCNEEARESRSVYTVGCAP